MLLFTIDYDFRLLVASASSNITPVKMLRLQCDILMELVSTTELFGTVFAWIGNRSLNHWTFTESTGTLDLLRADSMEEESQVGKFETSIGRTSTVAEVATVILSQRQTNPFDLITTTYYHLNKKGASAVQIYSCCYNSCNTKRSEFLSYLTTRRSILVTTRTSNKSLATFSAAFKNVWPLSNETTWQGGSITRIPQFNR